MKFFNIDLLLEHSNYSFLFFSLFFLKKIPKFSAQVIAFVPNAGFTLEWCALLGSHMPGDLSMT